MRRALRSGWVRRTCFDAGCLQILEAFAVGVDRRSRTDVLLDEIDHRGLFEVRDHRHPNATGDATAVFNRRHHNRRLSAFELTTAPQAGLWPADPGVVDLHLAMQRLARRVDHGTPQLVQQHPCGFVPAESQLPLDQERRDPPRVGRHEIRGPEPHGLRHLRVVKNRSGRQGDLVLARDTSPASVFQHPIGSPVSTSRTAETLRPATCGQIPLAGLLGRELTLKLTQVSGKGRTRHPRTLHLVAC